MGRWLARGVLVLLATVGTPVLLHSQSPQPSDAKPLAFEVTSIKPNTTHDDRGSVSLPPGRFLSTNLPLRSLLRFAYNLQDSQLTGGPAWVGADRFDLAAAFPTTQINAVGQAPDDTLRSMVRALVADRFRLVVHHETRELPVYALVVTRTDQQLGPQLHKATVDCAARRLSGQGPPPLTADGTPLCGGQLRPGHVMLNGFALSELANNLSTWVDHIVIDRTGLIGPFNVTLDWGAELRAAQDASGTSVRPESTPDGSGPSIFTAVQEQLGLKLESTRGPVDVLVIDHVERPTPD